MGHLKFAVFGPKMIGLFRFKFQKKGPENWNCYGSGDLLEMLLPRLLRQTGRGLWGTVEDFC
jgi:hypothetical protein